MIERAGAEIDCGQHKTQTLRIQRADKNLDHIAFRLALALGIQLSPE